MIFDIDEALRELLKDELKIGKGEIDISFEQPKREWSSKLNKPTVNLFLYDIRENIKLRMAEDLDRIPHEAGTVTLKRKPLRVDLHYFVTSWAKEIQDEHNLLSGTLIGLLRHPSIEEKFLPDGLKNHPHPIHLEVAHGESFANPHDLWNSLDNHLHPGIRLTVTISVDPYEPVTFPQVSTMETRFFQNASALTVEIPTARENQSRSKSYSKLSGRITSEKYSLGVLSMVLKETGLEIPINQDGTYLINNLEDGVYHLDILANGRVLKHQTIDVPSSTYDIDV
jgi:hypothetical protein